MHVFRAGFFIAFFAILSGCANKKPDADPNIKALTSYTPVISRVQLKVNFPKTPKSSPFSRAYGGNFLITSASVQTDDDFVEPDSLRGRTIYAANQDELKLNPGEVILTFDDGPVPQKTEAILNILDKFDVKATFLVVGNMVNYHSDEFAEVVARGHTIGSHTKDHAKLTEVSFDQARAKIRAGEDIIKAKMGVDHVPFFRFPYLAETPALRDWLARRDVIVLDVDIDSKDYFKETPRQIVDRTMARVIERGSGNILFHDIHARSVAALPIFLRELKAAGFKVVTLKADEDRKPRLPFLFADQNVKSTTPQNTIKLSALRR